MDGLAGLEVLMLEEDRGEQVGLAIQPQKGPVPEFGVETYRLYWVEDGVEVRLDGQRLNVPDRHLLTLSPGEEVVFPPQVQMRALCFHHNFFCVRVKREEVFCDGVVFNRLTGLPVVSFPAEEAPFLTARLDELSAILQRQGSFAQDRAVNALRALLLHAAEFKLKGTLDGADAGQAARLSPLVLAFQSLLEAHFLERKDLAFYSEKLGVTGVTLNRHVKEELGKTVMQPVGERLAIEARVALRSGQKSVKEVAFDLGFQDPLYFSRFFKKHFGSPPSEYFRPHGIAVTLGAARRCKRSLKFPQPVHTSTQRAREFVDLPSSERPLGANEREGERSKALVEWADSSKARPR